MLYFWYLSLKMCMSIRALANKYSVSIFLDFWLMAFFFRDFNTYYTSKYSNIANILLLLSLSFFWNEFLSTNNTSLFIFNKSFTYFIKIWSGVSNYRSFKCNLFFRWQVGIVNNKIFWFKYFRIAIDFCWVKIGIKVSHFS